MQETLSKTEPLFAAFLEGIDIPVPAELQHILRTYARSKTLRYGVAFLETEERFRHVLAAELGTDTRTLKRQSDKVKYWPYTKPLSEMSATWWWSDKEDNLIMDLWQCRPKETIYQSLPHRTIDAVNRRASFLGVTRELTKQQ